MHTPQPALTPLDLEYASGAILLAALVTSAVLRRPSRYPAPAAILVIVLVFVLALAAARIDPVLITALVGAAGLATARLASPRSRQI